MLKAQRLCSLVTLQLIRDISAMIQSQEGFMSQGM